MHEYSDNNCQNKVKTDTVAVGETFPEGEVKLVSLECSDACNCDYIEMYAWEVPADEVCGSAKDHMDSITTHVVPRSTTFTCIKSGSQSVMYEIDGCQPKKTVNGKYGTVGRTLLFQNDKCQGDAIQTVEMEITEPTDKGVLDNYDPTVRHCQSINHCDNGMNHAGVEVDGVMIASEIDCESVASQVPIGVAIVSLIFSIISLF